MANSEWKCLQSEKLAIDPNAVSAEDDWKFWYKTFTNFVAAIPQGDNAINKLNILTAYLTAPIYKLISEEITYDGAIATLRTLFGKPKHEIYSRHKLATARQNESESVDEFVLRINKLGQDCNFVAVNAQQYRDDMKRDSFISGISSCFIRERLLENRTLTFTQAYEKARALEIAKLNSEQYSSSEVTAGRISVCTVETDAEEGSSKISEQAINSVRSDKKKRNFSCNFCGRKTWHPRSRCPAKDENCNFCGNIGHYAKCCLKRKDSLNCVDQPSSLASSTTSHGNFSQHVLADITVNNIAAQALVDTGSTNSYISKNFVKKHNIPYKSMKYVANLVNVSLQTEICSVCYLNLIFMGECYNDF